MELASANKHYRELIDTGKPLQVRVGGVTQVKLILKNVYLGGDPQQVVLLFRLVRIQFKN
jgi:hypothetical protein